jgi:hypothetical protein
MEKLPGKTQQLPLRARLYINKGSAWRLIALTGGADISVEEQRRHGRE